MASLFVFPLNALTLLIFQKNLNICTNLTNSLIIKDIRSVQIVCRGVQIGASPSPSLLRLAQDRLGGGTESPLLTSPLGEETEKIEEDRRRYKTFACHAYVYTPKRSVTPALLHSKSWIKD